jgi:hypothetical protein
MSLYVSVRLHVRLGYRLQDFLLLPRVGRRLNEISVCLYVINPCPLEIFRTLIGFDFHQAVEKIGFVDDYPSFLLDNLKMHGIFQSLISLGDYTDHRKSLPLFDVGEKYENTSC